jgi:hypothetical protein
MAIITKEEFGVVHLWQPLMWHCNQYIVGNKAGLKKLADAIQKSLESEIPVITKVEMFTSDGEGHDIVINVVSDKDAEHLAVPYTDEIAEEHESNKNAIFPWNMV